ncbi:MAG: hypothetical protein R3F20_16005 [Planctomycetota bacterium]
MTGTGAIHGYDLSDGSLSLVAQLPEPATVAPNSTPGYAASLDESADCAYFLQSSFIGAGTVVARLDLSDGTVTTTSLDFSDTPPGNVQWIGGSAADRAGRVIVAARRGGTLLGDLLRLDLGSGTLETLEIGLRPFEILSLWHDDTDLDRPLVQFDRGIYSADFPTGALTLLAR